MDDLVKRYCQTIKGRHIIVALMENPIKLCRVVYKNDKIHYKVDNKLMDELEVKEWKVEQQKIHKDECMKKWSLTEDDFELSEEKLAKIIYDETIGSIRNISLIEIGCGDSEELKNAIQECIPRIRDCHEIGSGK